MKEYTLHTTFAFYASYPVFTKESWVNDKCDGGIDI